MNDRPLAMAKKRIVLPSVQSSGSSEAVVFNSNRPPIPAPVTIRSRGVLATTTGAGPSTPPHAQSPKVERIRVLNANVQSGMTSSTICASKGQLPTRGSHHNASRFGTKHSGGLDDDDGGNYDGDSSFSEEEVLDELDSVVQSHKSQHSKYPKAATRNDDDDDDDDDIDAQLRAIDDAESPSLDSRRNQADKKKLTANGNACTTTAMRQLEQQQDEDAAAEAFGPLVTEEFLRNKTGYDDLHLVTSTELRLDVGAAAGAYLISEKLAALVELRMSGSNVPCFRLLGTKFANLRVLWLNNCHVKDLSGIRLVPKLQELYIAFNMIEALDEVAFLDDLQVLDAEANNISDASQIEQLSSLKNLRHVTLSGNPFIEKTFMSFRLYRVKVKELLPQIDTLDDICTNTSEAKIDVTVGRGGDDDGDAAASGARSNGPSLERSDTSSTSHTTSGAGGASARFLDPLALADELMLVHASIRATANNTLDTMIEDQNRPLYSRQSTSCSGARKRTPAATSAPTGSQRLPAAGTSSAAASSGRTAASSAPGDAAKPTGRTAGVTQGGASSNLTSGKAFTGSLTRNLRAHRASQQASIGLGHRRGSAPTLAAPPQPVTRKQQSSLTVLDGGSSVPSTPVALRSSGSASMRDDDVTTSGDDDVVDETALSAADRRLSTKKASNNGESTPDSRKEPQQQAALAEALERTPTFAFAGDEVDPRAAQESTLVEDENVSPARPQTSSRNAASELMRKYGHLLGSSEPGASFSTNSKGLVTAASSSSSCGDGGDASSMISVREVVAAVVKHKSSTANAVKESLMSDRKNYESLALSDLGGDVDDVL